MEGMTFVGGETSSLPYQFLDLSSLEVQQVVNPMDSTVFHVTSMPTILTATPSKKMRGNPAIATASSSLGLTSSGALVTIPNDVTGADLGKRLLSAARRGDTEQVRLLMSNGAPFATDWLGISPLHMACQNGHVDTAEVLLRAGISRDIKSKVDRTPLHVAAQEGKTGAVQLLLKSGADVDCLDMLRMTPLHWAAENGHLHVCRALLKKGANPYAESKFDRTPIDHACGRGFFEIASALQESQYQPLGENHEVIKTPNSHLAGSTLKYSTMTYKREDKSPGLNKIKIPIPKDINLNNIKNIKTPIKISGIDPSTSRIASGTVLNIPGQKCPIVICPTDPGGNRMNEKSASFRLPSVAKQSDLTRISTAGPALIMEADEEEALGEGEAVEASQDEDPHADPHALNHALNTRWHALNSENGEPLMPPEILTWFQSRGLTVVSDGAQGDANQGHTLTVSDDRIPLSISQGQTLTLTEAGRLALEETQENRLVTDPSNDIPFEVTSSGPCPVAMPTSWLEGGTPTWTGHEVAEIDGQLREVAEIHGQFQEVAEMGGRLQQVAEVDGQIREVAEIDGRLREVATVSAIDENGEEKVITIAADDLARLQEEMASDEGVPMMFTLAPEVASFVT